jgi:hypothetical protein
VLLIKLLKPKIAQLFFKIPRNDISKLYTFRVFTIIQFLFPIQNNIYFDCAKNKKLHFMFMKETLIKWKLITIKHYKQKVAIKHRKYTKLNLILCNNNKSSQTRTFNSFFFLIQHLSPST